MLRVNFCVLWREATRGKSIYRILMNECLKLWREEIRGTVLDFACGQEPSYWRILDLKNNEKVRLVGIDYNPAFRPTIVANLIHSTLTSIQGCDSRCCHCFVLPLHCP
jgi:hypothetical protein